MPRLSNSLIRKAWNIDSLLPLLLRECRSLPSAQNELRWIKEHLIPSSTRHDSSKYHDAAPLISMCRRRARGTPLQYLLGTQPFGELDILCKPGVLVPRPETESYTSHLADIISKDENLKGTSDLSILDLCTGTGAIAILLHSLLRSRYQSMNITGVDYSSRALQLANDNVQHNSRQLRGKALSEIQFHKANVLASTFAAQMTSKVLPEWDIIISNPPYISPRSYWKDTSRSARLFEPKSALVAGDVAEHLPTSPFLQPEDVFYPAILSLAKPSKAKIVLMEVADLSQALRVARYATSLKWFQSIEIWRDWPQDGRVEEVEENCKISKTLFKTRIVGTGHGRSVVCRL